MYFGENILKISGAYIRQINVELKSVVVGYIYCYTTTRYGEKMSNLTSTSVLRVPTNDYVQNVN